MGLANRMVTCHPALGASGAGAVLRNSACDSFGLRGQDRQRLRIKGHEQPLFGRLRIQPPCFVLLPEHSRHPIMEFRDRLVRRGRNYRVGLDTLSALGIPPRFPEAREREDALLLQLNPRLGSVPLGAGPLVEGSDRNQAPAGPEGVPEGRLGIVQVRALRSNSDHWAVSASLVRAAVRIANSKHRGELPGALCKRSTNAGICL